MKYYKTLMLAIFIVITGCNQERHVEEKVATQELDNAIDAYLEKNKEEASEYWDFSDPEPVGDDAVSGSKG